MKTFFLFLVTSLISFLGSVQLGPVNMMVIQTSLQKSIRNAVWLSIGGVLPEFIYAVAALQGSTILEKSTQIITAIELASIPIFFVIGILNFRKKEVKTLPKTGRGSDFIKGFSLAMLNPQLLPFWLVVLVSLKTYFSVDLPLEKVAFVLGTGVGALVLLLTFVWLSQRYKDKILQFFQKIPADYIVGSIFIGLSLFQLFRYIQTHYV